MGPFRSLPRRPATRLMGSTPVNSVIRAAARLRGRALNPDLSPHRAATYVDCEVVQSVPVNVFGTHLPALRELVDLVPIDFVSVRGTGVGLLGLGARRG